MRIGWLAMTFKKLNYPRPGLVVLMLRNIILAVLVPICIYLGTGEVDARAQDSPTMSVAVPNKVTHAAFAKGVLKCSSRLQQVTSFASPKDTQVALITFYPPNPDNGLVSVIQEVDISGNSGYVSSNFAPNQASGCQASYDAVSFWKQSCRLVAEEIFKDLREIKDLRSPIKVLDGGPFMKVVLMPADSGCVSIKKEIIY
jgi:hypothetical protein